MNHTTNVFVYAYIVNLFMCLFEVFLIALPRTAECIATIVNNEMESIPG
jgi:hypothetical protein